MKLKLSPRAKNDLAEIYDYIAQDNAAAAKRVAKRLREQMKYIMRHPKIAPGRDYIIKGLRALPVDSYMIYYLLENSEIKIIRVLHATQDVQNKLP